MNIEDTTAMNAGNPVDLNEILIHLTEVQPPNQRRTSVNNGDKEGIVTKTL